MRLDQDKDAKEHRRIAAKTLDAKMVPGATANRLAVTSHKGLAALRDYRFRFGKTTWLD